MSDVHIYSPPWVQRIRGVRRCTVCKSRRRFVAWQYEWYGAISICCACGTTWNDGMRRRASGSAERRAKGIRDAKALWIEIGNGGARE